MSLDRLDQQFIQSQLASAGIEVTVFATLPSTNDYLKNHTSEKNWHLCLAEQQTAGRGRFTRHWFSPKSLNLYASLAKTDHYSAHDLQGLAQWVSIVLGRTINQQLASDVVLKWPNDLLYHEQKLAGILVEVLHLPSQAKRLVIGFGVNVNMQEAPIIDHAWTSLARMTGQTQDRNQWAVDLTRALLQFFAHWPNTETTLSEAWRPLDALKDQSITLQHAGTHHHGIARGITEDGALLLEVATGEIQTWLSGDCSLTQ